MVMYQRTHTNIRKEKYKSTSNVLLYTLSDILNYCARKTHLGVCFIVRYNIA